MVWRGSSRPSPCRTRCASGRPLAYRIGVLLLAERQVVPLHAALHEGDTTALDGAQDNHLGPDGAAFECGMECGRVVAVNLLDLEAEAPDFLVQRLERGDL